MSRDATEKGVLYIVATPIGNLQDMTWRAVDTLKSVDRVAAEDTRHTRKLFAHYGIATPLLALHEHNERDISRRLLDRLLAGERIALVSDAGTPLISDPGFVLVRAARQAGVRVVPVPGPSALVAALSVSGLPTDRFLFEGFLPPRQAARRQRLQALRGSEVTLVFYESSHRILDSLVDMADCLGAARHAVIARELTKTFETLVEGTLTELLERLRNDTDQQKGEFVVLVQGAAHDPDQLDEAARRTLEILLGQLPLRQAAALAAGISGVSKNRLYEYGLELKNRSS
ncbi:MAG TPA: 16S rRNA (cytidine(1402)-2'-O)-methyltransferase [Gammaproteobacteria bacterium]|nr:16S rRNA (cytidine(1402)-2'-O)-methyltransferase [Gammaproteobacteria bacterium]